MYKNSQNNKNEKKQKCNKVEKKTQGGYVSLIENYQNSIDGGPPLKNLIGATNNNELLFLQNAEEFKLFADYLIKDNENRIVKYPNSAQFIDNANAINNQCSHVLVYVKINDSLLSTE